MGYVLGDTSRQRLTTVNMPLQHVVQRAISITKQDFSVIEGIRSVERQRELVNSGKSQTMNSRHISGNAVDLVAWNGKLDWGEENYYPIADAMFEAARELGISLRWGAAWHIEDAPVDGRSAWDICNEYVDLRRSQGRTPFLDFVHFELPESIYG